MTYNQTTKHTKGPALMRMIIHATRLEPDEGVTQVAIYRCDADDEMLAEPAAVITLGTIGIEPTDRDALQRGLLSHHYGQLFNLTSLAPFTDEDSEMDAGWYTVNSRYPT
jgi:hypothetical protein